MKNSTPLEKNKQNFILTFKKKKTFSTKQKKEHGQLKTVATEINKSFSRTIKIFFLISARMTFYKVGCRFTIMAL